MGLQVLELKEQCKPAMVSSADDLIAWRDFPKGLRVLLLDEDGPSASETRLKLEAMDYIVSTFYNEKDALEVISNKGEIFHVAIVEVTSGNSHVGFKFLETAKDLPTVVISNIRCLSTMMKCIALGAAEFLQKPLSEDKLSNIWQHVVHKAFNAGGNVLAKSLKPVKQTVVSMLNHQSGTAEFKIEVPCESENEEKNQKNPHGDTITTERFSAPSTPQPGVRLRDVGDYEEHVKFSMEKENTENTKDSNPRKYDCSESKSVDNTCNDFTVVVNKQPVLPYTVEGAGGEEEVDSADWSKTDESSVAKEDSLAPSGMQIGDHLQSRAVEPTKKSSTLPINPRSHGKRRNRKSMKVDWTQELHKKFVRAVEQLGIDQAIPSKILDLMKVDGLTRHNVASHLQKFRMHKRHILPKDDDMRWRLHRDPMPAGYMRKPLVAFPPFPSNYGLPPNQVYPVWGHPSYLPSGAQMWGHVGFPPCHPPLERWVWNSYPPMQADVWGYPVVPPYSQYMNSLQAPPVSNAWDANLDIDGMSRNYYTVDMATEGVIDEMVKEAMSKPWLPLPLGLKPPSTDVVIAELHRQGIPTIPPPPSAAPSAE